MVRSPTADDLCYQARRSRPPRLEERRVLVYLRFYSRYCETSTPCIPFRPGAAPELALAATAPPGRPGEREGRLAPAAAGD